MYKIFLKALLLFILLVMLSSFFSSDELLKIADSEIKAPVVLINNNWTDSLMKKMTLKQKVAQLFMISVYSNKPESYNKQIINLVAKYQVGGVIFMQGGPVRQVHLNNRLQSVVNIPLMVGMDAEWGLSMRLDSTITYPRAMAMGAIQDDKLIFQFGEEMAEQCRRLGVHISFAPVLDINNNPINPVINSRSFGEDKFNVARKGLAYAMGLQNKKVLAVGKHFPGHGNTQSDSHKTLPTISQSKEQLFDLELFPFKKLISSGIGGIMVAHLSVPALESKSGLPSTLSSYIVDSLLHNQFKFKGLVFTDALNMKGVTNNFKPGTIEVKSLQAGNDVLLFSVNVETGINAVLKAVELGKISEEQINEKCRKVLNAKKWLGLDSYKNIETENIVSDLNKSKSKFLKVKLAEASLTLAENKLNLIPIKKLQGKRILAIGLQQKAGNSFFKYLNLYAKVDTISIDKNFNKLQLSQIVDTISAYDLIIVSQHGTNNSPWKNYGIDNQSIKYIRLLLQNNKMVFVLFGNPYALNYYKEINKGAVLVAYNDTPEANKNAAQAIFGGKLINGKLPVTANEFFKVGQGENIHKKTRLSYESPEAFDLPNNAFYKVDSIVLDAIEMKATPGCQVLFAKHGKVIYNKAFGNFTYEQKTPVLNSSIYDLASLTKVAASTICMMKLYEQKKIKLSAKVSTYLPELKNTDKEYIRLNSLMSHQAGLRGWIPFYKHTLDEDGNLRQDLFRSEKSYEYSIQVCKNLFLHTSYYDSIYNAIVDTALESTQEYKYSDLGFYWIAKIIENTTGSPINEYSANEFYEKLGMNHTGYLPLKKHKLETIVPTENDLIFRKCIVQGYVHDPGAAMIGGVSGHAGLFANANDLAKLGQMLLNEGEYGGDFYLTPKTISTFNTAYFKRNKNRRAIGFDKPALLPNSPSPTCKSASQLSFGHSGFTGTYIWIDPEQESIYIFLSNRTFPTQKNKLLIRKGVRTKIQQVFYDVLSNH